MSTLTQRREYIYKKMIANRTGKTKKEKIASAINSNKWIVWIHGIILFFLFIFILAVGLGSLYHNVLMDRWKSAALIATFALIFTLNTSTLIHQRLSLCHLQKLFTIEKMASSNVSATLNERFNQILFKRSRSVTAVIIPLVGMAVIQIWMENNPVWPYLGPVYAVALLIICIERYHNLKLLKENISAFEKLSIDHLEK